MEKRYMIIEDNKVVNIVVFNPNLHEENGWVEEIEGVQIGHVRDEKGDFVAPEMIELIPATVSAYGLKRALRKAGLKKQFEEVIAKMDEEAQEEWALKPTHDRTSKLLNVAAADLGLTPDRFDKIFSLAAQE